MAQVEIKNIDELLREYLGKDAKILGYTTKQLTAPGDNYGSLMLSADIKVQQNGSVKELKAVAKMLPASEYMRIMFHVQETVTKELLVYRDAAPALLNLQKEMRIPEEKFLDVFPKYYGGRLNLNGSDKVDENAVIVLENLQPLGFGTGNRLVGFNLQDSKVIIRSLARFHAVPIALKILKPETFKSQFLPSLKPCLWGDDDLNGDIDIYSEELIRFLGSHPDCAPYVKKTVEIVRKAFSFVLNMAEPVEPFATIVHNDFWVNNMMVRRENGDVTNVKIVDYQVSFYGSPVRDLVFFLFISIQDVVLQEHFDDFLKYYHECFIECLQEFKLDVGPFSYEAFDKELKESAQLEFGHILMLIKPIYHDKEKIKGADLSAPGMYKLEYAVPRYFTKVPYIILEFVKRGWIKLDE